MKPKAAIAMLTDVGNALGLEGRFGVRWGIDQLEERLRRCKEAVFTDAPKKEN